MGSPSRNVQDHPPRLSEDRLNLPQPHSPSLPTHCSGKSGMRPSRAITRQRRSGIILTSGRSRSRAAPSCGAARRNVPSRRGSETGSRGLSHNPSVRQRQRRHIERVVQRVDQLRVRVLFDQHDQLPQDAAHDEAQGGKSS